MLLIARDDFKLSWFYKQNITGWITHISYQILQNNTRSEYTTVRCWRWIMSSKNSWGNYFNHSISTRNLCLVKIFFEGSNSSLFKKTTLVTHNSCYIVNWDINRYKSSFVIKLRHFTFLLASPFCNLHFDIQSKLELILNTWKFHFFIFFYHFKLVRLSNTVKKYH